jgi:hypothetical protein
MKFRFCILPIVFILFLISDVLAEVSLKAEVDKTSITVDENITYKLIIISSEKEVPQPQVAEFEDFLVLSQAQSSTVSFVKGTAKTILVYAFILAAKEAGKFKIKPSSIKIKDKVYPTDSFEIEVKAGLGLPRKRFALPEEENQTESQEVPRYTL